MTQPPFDPMTPLPDEIVKDSDEAIKVALSEFGVVEHIVRRSDGTLVGVTLRYKDGRSEVLLSVNGPITGQTYSLVQDVQS